MIPPLSTAAVHPLGTHIFVNCPFDADYKPVFQAILFTILRLEFVPRCALEVDDSGENRLEKVQRIIEECRYGIHDISSVGLDANTGLPRFNMPLELGLFLGCKRFGGRTQVVKKCLILDSEPYRYRASTSDIAGQDIHAHGGSPVRAITEVRNWLAALPENRHLPGGGEIGVQYEEFLGDLPALCIPLRRQTEALTFADTTEMIKSWLKDTF